MTDTRIDELIERSSLGTAGARQLRHRTPPAVARDLLDPATLTAETREAAAILANVRDRAQDAVHSAVELIRPLVTRYCRARLQREEVAAHHVMTITDAVCEDIERDLLARPDLAEESQLLRHAYRVASRHVASQPQPFRDSGQIVFQAGRDLSIGENHEALATALGQLDDVEREIILLRIVGGLSSTKTAEVLGLRPAAVRRIQHSALRTIRRKMNL